MHPGDYLCNITNTYNVSFAALLAVNNASTGSPVIDPQTLQLTSNMQLNVPHIPPQNCCPNFTYAVKAGESFFEISQRFSVDLAVLEEDNNHGPSNDQLTCGDQLVVRCQAGQPICQGEAWLLQSIVMDQVASLAAVATTGQVLSSQDALYMAWLA